MALSTVGSLPHRPLRHLKAILTPVGGVAAAHRSSRGGRTTYLRGCKERVLLSLTCLPRLLFSDFLVNKRFTRFWLKCHAVVICTYSDRTTARELVGRHLFPPRHPSRTFPYPPIFATLRIHPYAYREGTAAPPLLDVAGSPLCADAIADFAFE